MRRERDMRPRIVRILCVWGAMGVFVSIHATAADAQPSGSVNATLLRRPSVIRVRHASLEVLYDQRDHESAYSDYSSNAPGADLTDSSGADDFLVPAGESWAVQVVDAVGIDLGGLASERVRFFTDDGGLPGKVIATIRNVRGANIGGVLSIPLGSGAPILPAGHYWVAVQANSLGGWYWNVRTIGTNSPAAWENPRDGFGTGCTTWADLNACMRTHLGDLMFAIEGQRQYRVGGVQRSMLSPTRD